MKQEHRVMLVSIMAGLQALEDRYQIRTEGEQTYKAAKVELQKLLDLPEEEVKAPEVVLPSIDEQFKNGVMVKLQQLEKSLEKLDGFEDALGVLIAAIPETEAETPAEEAQAV